MTGFSEICPRCNTQISLEIIGCGIDKLRRPVFLLMCGDCEMPSMVTVYPSNPHGIEDAIAARKNITINRYVGRVAELLPAGNKPEAPEYTPPDAARVYVQARSAHQRRELDGAAMLYRKTLELALKSFDPTIPGMLGPRIKALAAKAALPPALIDWANFVRQIGNEGTHDLPEPTDEDVEDLFLFTESLLEYLFTMPGKLADRKARHHSEKGGS